MNVAIIGTGYVGLPTGVGLAELGNNVTCIDYDTHKIDMLRAGHVTLFEEGLDDLLQKNIASGRMHFTTSMADAVPNADIVILAVGTPPHPETGAADMKYIHAAATELATHLTGYTVVATKSTVPVGTGDKIEEIIRTQNPCADFDVVSLPEFLREGFAVYDFFNPDRIIVGANSERARDVLRTLYEPFAEKSQILFVNRRSSETIKYASNSFLAIKIHYINEMANFCEAAGADIDEVARGMGLDTRIGPRFLNAGPGYGGSCFPKDTSAMAYMADEYGVDMTLIKAAIRGNRARKTMMAERILNAVSSIENPKIAVMGLAFKNGTDDCRESPAIEIISDMLPHNVQITAFDPQATENAKRVLPADSIEYASDMYSALAGAEGFAILTEWDEFRGLDLARASELMRGKIIVDCRNLLNPDDVLAHGFKYSRIGRK